MSEIKRIAQTYSPWLDTGTSSEWDRLKALLPTFRRPVFDDIAVDISSSDQIVSVAGPRRVGKSTLLRQLIRRLMEETGVPPERIVYYSFDDPALYRPGLSGEHMFESLMQYMLKLGQSGPAYLFLDEIQTLNRWELFLKKYYDLKYPVKVVISGSASSPIFKKSRESLLGRVKDYHILPFSFREYLLFKAAERHPAQQAELDEFKAAGDMVKGMFAKDPAYIDMQHVPVPTISDELWQISDQALREYLVDGGFPEVWRFETQDKKIEYLFNNQVKKVITEDLVLAVEFRKPEQLKTFYISLLEQPGREVNMSKLSQELGINVQQIEKYLPLLEMTDLIRRAGKFRKSAVRVRKGYQKFYPVDLALRNAVLRVGKEVLEDSTVLGLYAETLVFNALKKWSGVLQIDYYRESQREVDFIVHTRPGFYLPVEVKYGAKTAGSKLSGLMDFRQRYPCHLPVVVTRDRNDFGQDRKTEVFRLPLALFLLMFD